MFKKVSFFLITFFFIAGTEASNKSKIILNLKSTKNMTFNFEQTTVLTTHMIFGILILNPHTQWSP